MDNDQSTLAAAIDWHRSGEQVALATVVQTWGSSPRPLGSHMAIRSDGVFVGSVSAGCVESAVVSGALKTLDASSAQTLDFGLSAWRNGLSCGGKIAVLVQPLCDAEPLLKVLQTLEAEQSCALAFDLASPRIDFLSDALIALPDRFIRHYRPKSRLVVAGAVHIAKSLGVMAELAGFDVSIIDPRREFALRGTFPAAPDIVWPDVYFKENPASVDTAIVSLTHAPKIDYPTLEAALKSPAYYIGALGSAATHAKRLRWLAQAGFDQSQLNRIHGPIGLPINAASPAEIAVSILAQIIAEKRSSRFDDGSDTATALK